MKIRFINLSIEIIAKIKVKNTTPAIWTPDRMDGLYFMLLNWENWEGAQSDGKWGC